MPVSLPDAGVAALQQVDPAAAIEHQRLGQAAEGFEAVLLQKMVAAMRATVPKSEDGGPGQSGQQMYDHLIDTALAEHLAGAGGVGIADMLGRSLGGDPVAEVAATRPGRLRGSSLFELPRAAREIDPDGFAALQTPPLGVAARTCAPADMREDARLGVSPQSAEVVPTIGSGSPIGGRITADDAPGSAPLADRLPPDSDPWIHSPDAELRLRAIFRGDEIDQKDLAEP